VQRLRTLHQGLPAARHGVPDRVALLLPLQNLRPFSRNLTGQRTDLTTESTEGIHPLKNKDHLRFI